MKGSLALRKPVKTLTLDMSSTNVTTSAWAVLVASLSPAASALEVINPSGSPIKISQGTAGNETAGLIPYTIPPGGTSGPYTLELKNGSPITVQAVGMNITAGTLILNFFG